jgi:hypothetical protein
MPQLLIYVLYNSAVSSSHDTVLNGTIDTKLWTGKRQSWHLFENLNLSLGHVTKKKFHLNNFMSYLKKKSKLCVCTQDAGV